jgi:copper transport protein
MPLARFRAGNGLLFLLVGFALGFFGQLAVPAETLSHANLQSSEPAADALLVTSPAEIRMTFTEAVAENPAPEVSVLDSSGASASDEPLAVTIDEDDPHSVAVQVPSLERGTWTVSWTVTSATDGHTLTGTWAFRIGGGLPPGQATTPDAAPAPWAVALRWLTFLGAASAAGLLLFPLLTRQTGQDSPVPSFTPGVALVATMVALLASLLEPVGGWVADRSIPFIDHVAALPPAWNWRPLTLIPLAIGLATCVRLRRAPGQSVAVAGAVLALASLLGLILTSHAAGREDDRRLAVAMDGLHQWSVALWTGGLLAFVLWTIRTRTGRAVGTEVRARAVSNIALVLVVVAVVTGVVNTTFMLDLTARVRADGFGTDAFADLWESRYGLVLLAKVALLIGPIALAWRHRGQVASMASAAGTWVSSIPASMQRSLRWETALVALVVLGGSGLAMSAPPAREDTSAIDQITLISPTAPLPSDDSFLVHLTLDPAQTGDNEISVRLSTWSGMPLESEPVPRVTLSFTSLSHGTQEGGVTLTQTPEGWTTSGLKLSLDGWWQVTATVQRAGKQNALASFMLLLPDPNTQGFDAPPAQETDPVAEALFDRALDQMTSWTSVRWTELIGSGLDVLVVGDFAVVEAEDGGSSSYRMDLLYSGSFAPSASGAAPPAPAFDTRSSVVVGDRGWMRTTNGDWLEEPPVRFTPPSGWSSTYAGATDFRMGAPQTVDGIEYQILLFHLPEQNTAEAWFAWWIDPATGDVMRINMISRMHYMTWLYRDINSDIVIDPPAGQPTSPEAGATPVAESTRNRRT